jgi:glyoxylase I family protein
MEDGSFVVMIARRLHHASFPVSDLERSMHFYGNILGLEPIDRPDFPFAGAWYRAGQCEVHLIVPIEGSDLGSPPPDLNPIAAHTAFAIDDYAATAERLRGEGLEVLELGAEMGQMWVRDPDGNIIEFIAVGPGDE